jgi:hypothetical protein
VKKGYEQVAGILLIIAILGGGVYGTYYLLNQNGIEIPFLSDYLKPKVDDPGNLKLTTYDINSKFVDNASVGKLFVVSGKVKNGYTENRGMITLLGKLFSPVRSRLTRSGFTAAISCPTLSWPTWSGIKSKRGCPIAWGTTAAT